MLVIPVLADIELKGLEVDCEAVEEEYRKQLGIRESAALALDEVTGGINLNSRPKLAALLYDKLGFEEARDFKGNLVKTKGGARATDEATLQSLEATTDAQRDFLERYRTYAKATTLLSKTLTFLSKVAQFNGGVFYGSILQCRTGTHRLASGGVGIIFPGEKAETKIQLQNVPREYKRLFTAHDPDYLVREDDGAQLEFRVAAELGNDPVAVAEIENGVDIHAFTRQVMRENKHPDFEGLDDKAARQEAKPHTFQPLYGGRGQHPAENGYADAWAAKYVGITGVQEGWCLSVAANKELVTPYGMRFYWPKIKMYPSGRVNKRSEIFNYPIQGFATAEIIPIALVYYWHRSRHLRVDIFNTVHDSIISRVHKDDNEALDAIAKQALSYDVYNFLAEVYDYKMSVPLGVGSKTSRHWGTAKIERVWDVWPDGRERYQEKD
jgi:DNA polymerase I-like protein with 3'-5' exonuclease and polymerase domains